MTNVYTTRVQSSARVQELEGHFKAARAATRKPSYQAICGAKILRVTNSNATRFIMAMPRDKSLLLSVLDWREKGVR